ncbi:hypothetical protein HAX54_003624 [Datura stramonium]|uniref:Uncharacterized protein n=1 Tax=Datura stramonium TaxID=4076 RepID=A0ABS8T6S4_DATST|nr:hypothetical protein [Datura stramonium]
MSRNCHMNMVHSGNVRRRVLESHVRYVGRAAHASARGHAEHRQPGAQATQCAGRLAEKERRVAPAPRRDRVRVAVPYHRLPPINIQVCALTFTLNISQIDSNVHSDDSP